ncbi:hypothetical protein BGZ63DRAFT_366927 [Mariannaea sp. PMI_226]|nr:hypothetical protein BGZ63DRAFT_366927 [Mariannaea sp. PMI_226]
MNGSANAYVRKKVAIVGSGCAGIAALWALNKTYHDVYMYEAADRLGGHTNTVQFQKGKYTTAVDTGFIALNTVTYPNFHRFLEKIGVKTDAAEMSFSVSRDRGVYEWAGPSLFSVFCQRRNILSLRMWRMIFDVFRFNQFAMDLLINEEEELQHIYVGNALMNQVSKEETLGQYLLREGYSDAFRDDYLIPLVATVWNTSSHKSILEFPVVTLVRFLWTHHHLTTMGARPQWLTLREGSKSYIDTVMKGFPPNHLFLKTSVRRVSNESDGRVRVYLENGSSEVYDHVILATHGDEALDIIRSSATEQEKAILSCFQTSQNEAVLHSDPTLMPARNRAWSSWNCLTLSSPSRRRADVDKISLTYNMNILQQIPRDIFGDVLVTLNPLFKPRPETVRGKFYYSIALYTPSAIRAQKLLGHIQNTRGISYAGAWTKYGFHEDAFSSGLYVAQEHLGAKLPYEFKDSTYVRGKRPRLGLVDHFLRLLILIIQVFVVQILERVVEFRRSSKPRMVNGYHAKRSNGKLW